MPSARHEVLAKMVRERPAFVRRLLRDLRIVNDERVEILESSESMINVNLPEYRADSVVRVLEGDALVSTEVFEAQLEADTDKRYAWPLYAAYLRARYRVPATVIVMAVDASVAKWCAEPIALDQNGSVFVPVVLGPRQIPKVTSEVEAEALPELAVLSVMAHGAGAEGESIARAGWGAVRKLDAERRELYSDVILASSSEAVRKLLEAQMENYEPQSDFFKRLIAEAAEKRGEQARVEGQREMLLKLLVKKFGELNAVQLEVVSGADRSRLETYVDRVLTADTIEAVLGTEE